MIYNLITTEITTKDLNTLLIKNGFRVVYSTLGSAEILPLAWIIPSSIGAVISVSAFPMSIWSHAISNLLPSKDVEQVRLVITCLVAV